VSSAQVAATALLCRLLQRRTPEINGQSLFAGMDAEAGKILQRERLLTIGPSLDWVTCPECGVELARVVRVVEPDQLVLDCPECETVAAPLALRQTYKVNLARVVRYLSSGIGLTDQPAHEVVPDRAWKLGVTEPRRGKPVTWYFARDLRDGELASALARQVAADHAGPSHRIVTSTLSPLTPSSPLHGHDVVHLADIGRISQSRFDLFNERAGKTGAAVIDPVPRHTTLYYLRAEGKVYVDGEAFGLEPAPRDILLALINDRDHEMSREALRDACGSQAKNFSPSKAFDRARKVYQTFVEHRKGDAVYALKIAPDDRGWISP
jgi:hypothetical protein